MSPALGFALEGVGPRVSLQGSVQEVNLTDEQRFTQHGGELVITANNSQTVTVVIGRNTKIIMEGRSSRKQPIPDDIRPDMTVRVVGTRLGTDSVNASLIVITNIQKNPALNGNGIIQSITDDSVTLLLPDGTTKTLAVDSNTEVKVNYSIRGARGMTLIGKQAIYTVSLGDRNTVNILTVTGNPDSETRKPIAPR
jgi:hypothetical protein